MRIPIPDRAMPTWFYQTIKHFIDPSYLFINSTQVSDYYYECTKTLEAGAWTPSVQACRTLISYIAVSKGAKEGETFIFYIDFLYNEGYLPKDGKPWVEEIRKKGNEAVHKIETMEEKEAYQIMYLSAMLVRQVYEIPYILNYNPSDYAEDKIVLPE